MKNSHLITAAVLLLIAAAVFLTARGLGPSSTGPVDQTPGDPAAVRPYPAPEPDARPERVGPAILRRYHPTGQSRYLVFDAQAQGTAANRAWGFEGNYYLKAYGTTHLRWEVLDNDGRTVTFRVHIPASDVTLLASQREYSVHLPRVPLPLRLLQRLPSPAQQVWVVWEVLNTADPDLRQSATALKKLLDAVGITENEIEALDLKCRRIAEDIQGVTATLVYEDGVGVTRRLALEGAEGLDAATLDRLDMQLRRMSPALGAYFLYPLQAPPGAEPRDTSVGAEWDVDAGHLAGLLSTPLREDVTGTVRLRRAADERGRVVLEIVDADIEYERPGPGATVAARLHVKPGTRITLARTPDGAYWIDSGQIDATTSIYRQADGWRQWLLEERFQADPSVTMRIVGRDPGEGP